MRRRFSSFEGMRVLARDMSYGNCTATGCMTGFLAFEADLSDQARFERSDFARRVAFVTLSSFDQCKCSHTMMLLLEVVFDFRCNEEHHVADYVEPPLPACRPKINHVSCVSANQQLQRSRTSNGSRRFAWCPVGNLGHLL